MRDETGKTGKSMVAVEIGFRPRCAPRFGIAADPSTNLVRIERMRRAKFREGVESQISTRGKRTPEFTEKNFPLGKYFFRLLFFFGDPLSQLRHAVELPDYHGSVTAEKALSDRPTPAPYARQNLAQPGRGGKSCKNPEPVSATFPSNLQARRRRAWSSEEGGPTG